MGTHTISTIGELEALYGTPKETSLAKETDAINETYRQWLTQARFFAMATRGSAGLDCSPRGDAADNAFKVIDPQTLVIPDRRGNNRLDSLRNIVEHPQVGLLFLIPGITEALRINGDASLSTDPQLLEQFNFNDKQPLSCIVVQVKAVYFQCARALLRSGLWMEIDNDIRARVPTAGQMVAGVDPDFDDTKYDSQAGNRLKDSLY